MDTIRVSVRLRPVRFGFMVRPEDKGRLEAVFQINTCLWGGLFNPVIPFFKRVPKWWERKGYKYDNSKQIINGYLDYFEPDFVVEAEKGISAGLGIDPERILQLSDILPRDGQCERKGHGQTVLDLYRQLYREEYQFVRRHEQKIVHVKAAAPAFKGFAACMFGAFPKDQNLRYFGKAFSDAFDPEEIILDSGSVAKLYRGGFPSALRMGRHGLNVDYNDHSEPTLFILDAHESRDLLDWWNYRAVHRSGIPVPIQWLPELSDFCRSFIIQNHRPLPGNPNGVMIQPTCMFSRSIPDKDIEDLHRKYLRVEKSGANTLQRWYPPIWREAPEIMVRRTRPTITAAEKDYDVTVDIETPQARFESLHPKFSERFGSENRWANVVRLKDWSGKDRIATVFPTDFRIRAVPKFSFAIESLLSTNEGIITFPQYHNVPQHWDLIEGQEAIKLWLERNRITCKLSESGRATQQIILTLGGFRDVGKIALKQIIELFDGMSRRPIARSAHFRKFEGEIANAVKGDIWRGRILETLVERKAIELGYELKCTKCGNWSWYPLNQLESLMTCDLCLRKFEFPLTCPTDNKRARWAYRVIGPFALPQYARGGYAAALAIRFFAGVVGHMDRSKVTWSPGQELTLPSGTKVEADFLVWYQRQEMFAPNHKTEIVFGEAKSFGKEAFKDEDIDRLRLIAEQFPGTILVLATLKEARELSKDEIQRIRHLAQWGREYDKEKRQTRAPVIVLTGTELFTPHYLEEVWKAKGGKHRSLIEPGYVRLDRLRTLADLTQQLYLGMPSYSAWRERRFQKKLQKARASSKNATRQA